MSLKSVEFRQLFGVSLLKRFVFYVSKLKCFQQLTGSCSAKHIDWINDENECCLEKINPHLTQLRLKLSAIIHPSFGNMLQESNKIVWQPFLLTWPKWSHTKCEPIAETQKPSLSPSADLRHQTLSASPNSNLVNL